MQAGNWNYPTQIRFGAGKITELTQLLKQIKSQNPLIVTDRGLADSTIIKTIKSLLKNSCIEPQIFSEIKPNPTGENVDKGTGAYRKGVHDSIIAVGGGSGLDAGKAIALMAGQERDLFDFEDEGDNWTRVDTDGMAPVIAIPTTAGTGSEVGRASVIIDQKRHKKCIIFHPKMLPENVIADPELTVGLPPPLTAATGIDAMVHSLEAYLSPGYHPMADGIALQAIKLIINWLPEAYENGSNVEARGHMLAAATMGATAFQKGLGGVHALAHPLGALFDKHHGLLNAVLLPYVLVENKNSIENKIVHLNNFIGISQSPLQTPVEAFIERILKFRTQLDIPHTLGEIGIGLGESEKIGKMAEQDPSATGNPKPLNAQQYATIFCNAVSGKMNEFKTDIG